MHLQLFNNTISRLNYDPVTSLKSALQITLFFCCIIIIYGVLLYNPEPAFPNVVRYSNLTLMTALPYPQEASLAILKLVREKVKRSPFFNEEEQYSICICQTAWRKKIFFSNHQQSGGLCYPGSRIVYINGVDLINNRLISPSGKAVMDERTLDYFIAHEITHSMVGNEMGVLRFLALPAWIKEGYADHIGRGGVFSQPGAREAYLSDAAEMTTPVMAPYLRYNFMVSYLLDQLHWTAYRLHKNPITQDVIEQQVRQYLH